MTVKELKTFLNQYPEDSFVDFTVYDQSKVDINIIENKIYQFM